MECISWFAPILPDKLDAWKAFTEESKARKHEHVRSRQRAGVTREVASLVQTPQGNFVSVFLEAENVSRALKTMLDSGDPYDQWFFRKAEELHGLTRDVFEGPLPSEVYFDYRDGDLMTPANTREGASARS